MKDRRIFYWKLIFLWFPSTSVSFQWNTRSMMSLNETSSVRETVVCLFHDVCDPNFMLRTVSQIIVRYDFDEYGSCCPCLAFSVRECIAYFCQLSKWLIRLKKIRCKPFASFKETETGGEHDLGTESPLLSSKPLWQSCYLICMKCKKKCKKERMMETGNILSLSYV